MRFIIIDEFKNQSMRDRLDVALRSNGYKGVVCWIVNKHNHQDFQNLVSQLKDDIWDGLVILQRVSVTEIKTDPETEIFQRDLEDSQINILIEYYRKRLNDDCVEIVDLRV